MSKIKKPEARGKTVIEADICRSLFESLNQKKNATNIEIEIDGRFTKLETSQCSKILQDLIYRFAHPTDNQSNVERNKEILKVLLEKLLSPKNLLNNNYKIIRNYLWIDPKSGMNFISSIFRNEKLSALLFNHLNSNFFSEDQKETLIKRYFNHLG